MAVKRRERMKGEVGDDWLYRVVRVGDFMSNLRFSSGSNSDVCGN